MSSLLIRQYEIGPLNNFLYLLGDPATKEMAKNIYKKARGNYHAVSTNTLDKLLGWPY